MADTNALDEHRLLLRALQEAADHLTMGVLVLSLTEPERVLYVNDGAAAIAGRPRAELEGASPFILFAPELVEKERERIAARGRGAAPPTVFETVISRPDGTRVPVEAAVSRVVTATDTLTVTFVRDISARLEAVETLRRSEERFRRVVENAPDGVAILQRGRIVFLNELAAELFGLPNPQAGLGTLGTDHLVPEDAALAADRLGRIVETGASFDPMEYRPRTNPERILEIKSILIDREGEPAVLSFARDVSARKRIEQELVRADRLASIGMMSAAVAHEINNPLAYVRLCLQFLERELPGLLQGDKREWAVEQLRNANHGIDRVATIVRDLRSFARADSDEVGRVDVVTCIEQAIKLVDNEVRHRAQLVRDFHDVPALHANASRLEQVFVNVLVNAAQAIPAGDVQGHEIRIAVRSPDDNTVAVSISDSGPGIPPELRGRVFEPFFSTKAVGVGTGLGLAVCRSIVEQLGGRIELDQAARGAVVTITLPVHHGEPSRAPEPPVVEPAAPRRLRVLVVDDEPLVRRALANVLGSHHEVSLAEHGRQALELIAANPVDVVICDMMMPVMNGKELYEHLLAHEPALARRFVFITGGSFGPNTTFLEQVQAQILYKPFDLVKVLEVVAAAAER